MAPATHKALVVVEKGVTEVRDKAPPKLQPDTVLVKVKAVALNPTDWKHVGGALKPGSSTGSDFAGVVAEVGEEAEGKGFKVGDAVAGFTRGGFLDPENGAFQEYIAQFPELLWHKPELLSYEDAAPMGGIALSTAAQALYYRLPLPKPWEPTNTPFPILIWAGSTGVGMYAIKLAKASGLLVATTASPRNHDLLKKMGADLVLDYNDPEAPKKIKEWAQDKGGIKHALDTISEHGSTKKAAGAFSGAGTIIRILTLEDEVKGLPEGIEAQPILIYSVLKKKNEQDFNDHAEWYQHLPKLIESGKITPVPRKHYEGGMAAIPQGLDYLKAGKASAEKITFTFE